MSTLSSPAAAVHSPLASPIGLSAPLPGPIWSALMDEAGWHLVHGGEVGRLIYETLERLASEVLACETPGVPLASVAEFEARREAMRGGAAW